ncbi:MULTISPECIES: hypothetical protein [Rhizobium]|uniref:hypothetical protein n=1 Tax=Rhizobium TaxID=379 RepID=UPI00046280DB|nr:MULTISPECIES: hypothetical protein [Rhizobium]MCA0804164.1 hypothetical protein [Rhizobium sp. T1473]MCS0459984.1 hypothetical protein [Rhizobium favelukesii]UFS82299.1 hypothetical protein LPB79_29180 [Rhizobium sp. T136]
MSKSIPKRAPLQRRQRRAVGRVVQVADQRDILQPFGDALVGDVSRIRGLGAAEAFALKMVDHDEQRRSG